MGIKSPCKPEHSSTSSGLSRVGIVVVNYNALDDVLRCVSSLRHLNYPNFFIVIVDSCSLDGSGYFLRDMFSDTDVSVILSPENKGFAAANNIGISYAVACEVEYVWLVNADAEVDPDALSHLVDSANSDWSVGALGSKILYASQGEGCDNMIWGIGGILDFAKQELDMCGTGEHDRGQWDKHTDCDYIPGCSLFVRKSVLDAVGFLPESYFMYFEETDWCTRMKQEGFLLRTVPESIVRHSFDDDKMQQPFGVYYYNRNRRFFWFRCGNIWQKLKVVLKTLFCDLPQAQWSLLRAPDKGLSEVFRAHRRSCVDFLLVRRGKSSYSR